MTQSVRPLMPTQVLVPPLGQTVDTLTFVRWLKQEGDAIRQGEPLFEVETDKATLEVEAPASGILTGVTARSGEEVGVLTPIAFIAEAASDRSPVDAPVPVSPPHRVSLSDARLFASPRARRLAAQAGVSIAAVTPTGPDGAIIERDVRAFLERNEIGDQRLDVSAVAGAEREGTTITPVARRLAEEASIDWRSLTGTGPRGRVTREDVEAALTTSQPAPESPVPSPQSPVPNFLEALPFTGIRSLIAERMTRSHTQTAPVTLTAEASATALVRLRLNLQGDGVDVSYNDLLLAILSRALVEHPRLNASLDPDGIKLWRSVDIGLAVDTERGLLVPVVRDVDCKGLAQIAQESKALAERARNGQCTPDELRGGTFTLTNLGMFGVDAFTPIINLPETAILGVGRIKTQPAWIEDHVEPRQMVWLSLTFDHRLVDGGLAARFLQRVVQLVEKPHLLMA